MQVKLEMRIPDSTNWILMISVICPPGKSHRFGAKDFTSQRFICLELSIYWVRTSNSRSILIPSRLVNN